MLFIILWFFSVDEREVTFKIDSDTFIIRSLKELVRAFQAANHTIVMDRFALAIQVRESIL